MQEKQILPKCCASTMAERSRLVAATNRKCSDLLLASIGRTTLLQNAQKHFLQGREQFTELVHEKRPAVGLQDKSGPVLFRTSKASLAIAQNNGFGQGFGETGAVHDDKGSLGPGTVFMDGPGKSSLPVPVSPLISTFEVVCAQAATRSRPFTKAGLFRPRCSPGTALTPPTARHSRRLR